MNQRAEAEYKQLLYAYTSLLQTLQYKQYENFCYTLKLFATPNQLGSSSFVTDETGKVHEQLA